MITIDKITGINSYKRRGLSRALRDALADFERVYRLTIEETPRLCAEALIDIAGEIPARAIVATLVNRSAWDGRISKAAAEWARGVDEALDEAASIDMWIYSNDIHMAHLDQIARAMAERIPGAYKAELISREQFRALEGVAYWAAERSINSERNDSDKAEYDALCRREIEARREECLHKLRIPRNVYEAALEFGIDWRGGYKSDYMDSYLGRRGIAIAAA